MESLFRFIARYHLFLIFVVLEGTSCILIYNSSYFRYASITTKADSFKGTVRNITLTWTDYFNLKSKNELLGAKNLKLEEENLKLRELNLLYNQYAASNNDTLLKEFTYIPAKVIENKLNRGDNKLILNIGANHGVTRDMGVISSDGVVGIVDRVSSNFSTVTSLLNNSREINGKLKKSGVFGPLVWDRKNIHYTEMIDIPQHVSIHEGDSIVTSGHSLTFPEGIFIGTVGSYDIDKGSSSRIKVKLSNDFQSLYSVYVISAMNKNELDSLKITY